MFKSLSEILKESSITSSRHFHEHFIFSQWEKSVGGTIAWKTSPNMVSGDILFVNTINSVWAIHLTALKENLINALNENIHPFSIKDIRFRAAYPLRRLKVPPDDHESPFEELEHVNLTEEEVEKSRQLSQEIDDVELGKVVLKILIKEKKWKKLKLSSGWKQCGKCGTLTGKPGLCPFCVMIQEEIKNPHREDSAR